MADKKKKAKSWLAINLEYMIFYPLYRLMQSVPLKTGYAIASKLAMLLYYADSRHRKRTISHLLHAGVCKDLQSAKIIAKKMYVEFGKYMVESFKIHELFDASKCRFSGDAETIRDYVKKETRKCPNHINVTAHYGNWEVAALNFAAHEDIRVTSIFRDFDNPKIGKIMIENRTFDGIHNPVSKQSGIRPALRALKTGGTFAILIDQHCKHSEGVETVFFGHPCRTHMTPALLHLKTGIPIIPHVTRRLPGSNFEFESVIGKAIVYQPTDDKEHDIQVITQMCTTALEKLIAEQPEQWLWTARRWLDLDGRHR